MKKTYDGERKKRAHLCPLFCENEEKFADGDKKAVRRRQKSEAYREKTADGLCGTAIPKQ